MKRDSINSLLALLAGGSDVSTTIFVQIAQKLERRTKNGKPYLEVQLMDVEGNLSLKIWENAPWYPDFCATDVETGVAVKALWHNTPYGVEATKLSIRPLSPQEEEEMLVGSEELRKKQDDDWKVILDLVAQVRDPRLAELSKLFIETYGARFRRAAAARGFHHARRGGLVEHTAGVMRTTHALWSAYPTLNHDLMITGALFHDCGKIWENGFPEHGLTMPYSDFGELLGHITLGIEVINRLWTQLCTKQKEEEWRSLTPPTEQVRLHLLHLVASHHGSLEFGSPVVPKTPEAFALNHADDVDAKMEMLRGAYETSPSLSDHIRQRKMPLPGNVADPLPSMGRLSECGKK